MNSVIAQGVLLRLLPSIIVLVLAFVAAADGNSRSRWSDLLYQLGVLPPEKKEDIAIQRGVRIPFFIVAACLLIWPIIYFRGADRTVGITEDSDLLQAAKRPMPTIVPAPTKSPVVGIANGAVSGNAATTARAPAAAPPASSTAPSLNPFAAGGSH